MRTLTKLVVLFMMVAATVSCTKDEIITPAVEVKETNTAVVKETNTAVVKVNGETYTMAFAWVWRPVPDTVAVNNSKVAAVWLGLPDTEADFDVLRDRAANLTIEVVSYTDDLTESKVEWVIRNALILALQNHTGLGSSTIEDGILTSGGGTSGGNPRYTLIFL